MTSSNPNCFPRAPPSKYNATVERTLAYEFDMGREWLPFIPQQVVKTRFIQELLAVGKETAV
jgi:hypothetical protein